MNFGGSKARLSVLAGALAVVLALIVVAAVQLAGDDSDSTDPPEADSPSSEASGSPSPGGPSGGSGSPGGTPPGSPSGPPDATGSPAPGPGVPGDAATSRAFVGTWQGEGLHLTGGGRFLATVTFPEARPRGADVATAEFGTPACTETWKLEMGGGSELIMSATVTGGDCPSGLRVEARLQPDGPASIRWLDARTQEVVSQAVLTRQ